MIGCLFGIFAFFLPRVAIILLGIFDTPFITNPFKSLSTPFNGLLLPILGCIFMPYTLLAYCLAISQNGSIGGMWTVLVVVAVLFDFGVIGHGRFAQRRSAARRANG